MPVSMHSLAVPTFVRMLNNLLAWLDKAEAHAAARKFDPNNFLNARLAPDMLPFTRQIQVASDGAKACIARLAGLEVPAWEDKEASIADLRERVRRTVDYVQSIPAAQIEGSESREITVPRRQGEPLCFTGEAYLKHFALPNFYFHVTTTYALLRHGGVDLGKADFLGR